ncbi:MAG: hypothetical protein OEN55_07220 [Alphaproteobacteria bacterium]|nr:hypothetical protein [Alphaproteobacteria bacterium]
MAGRLLPVFAALALGGCQVAHMALPQELQGETTKLAVEGRALSVFDGTFEFGPYRVTDVHRGWTRVGGHSVSTGASEFSISNAKQKYELSINGPDRPARAVQCATTADWSEMETEGFLGGRFGLEFSSDHQLVCTLTEDGGGQPAKLVMAQSLNRDTALHGVMVDGATRIDISATHKLDFTPVQVDRPTGYVFHIEGRPVGAVEVMNTGTVWLDDAAPPGTRSALAAASAVLLLYQDIQKAHEGIEAM